MPLQAPEQAVANALKQDAAVALAWAERCPAVEWATVEVRGVGPCYT